MTDMEPGGIGVQVVSDPGSRTTVVHPLADPVDPVFNT